MRGPCVRCDLHQALHAVPANVSLEGLQAMRMRRAAAGGVTPSLPSPALTQADLELGGLQSARWAPGTSLPPSVWATLLAEADRAGVPLRAWPLD